MSLFSLMSVLHSHFMSLACTVLHHCYITVENKAWHRESDPYDSPLRGTQPDHQPARGGGSIH